MAEALSPWLQLHMHAHSTIAQTHTKKEIVYIQSKASLNSNLNSKDHLKYSDLLQYVHHSILEAMFLRCSYTYLLYDADFTVFSNKW